MAKRKPKVKRYDFFDKFDDAAKASASSEGEYVSYRDYELLKLSFDKLLWDHVVQGEYYADLQDALKEIVAAKKEPHYGYIDTAWDHLSSAVEKHEHLVA